MRRGHLKRGRWALIGIVGLLSLLLVVPLLAPVPPAKETVPEAELADPDSRFLDVDGLAVHYKIAGHGEPVFLLLHGFGASTFSWREVMTPLAEIGTVVAFDRPAFGLTQRPMPGEWEEQSPYSVDAQVELTVGLMDALELERAILVGHSAGGTVSLLTALTHPERVEGMVLVAPAVYGGRGTPNWQRLLMRAPQMRFFGPLLVRRIQEDGMETLRVAWHDPARITPEVWAGYMRPLQAENWDRALWELTRARSPLDLAERVAEVDGPVLVVTGDDDRIVPTEASLRLARELFGADLLVIPNCGHLPHEECPQPFLQGVEAYIDRLH